jgi:ABC-type proline/glycine betaine transport system ATPase subunit
MKNVDLKVKDNKLTIVVDLTKEHGLSSSGKSTMIASTEGNLALPGMEDVKIGLNVYKKADR